MPQELKLLFEILRRWPGGYSFGEYLNAVEQHQMLLYIFSADDFAVQVEPADRWRIFQQDEWAAAIRSRMWKK